MSTEQMHDDIIADAVNELLSEWWEWQAEANQEAQRNGNPVAAEDFLRAKATEFLNDLWSKAWDSGWMGAAGEAMKICGRHEASHIAAIIHTDLVDDEQ